MQMFPVKGVSQVGINTDIAQFELPPNAWTDGMNVSFDRMQVNKATSIAQVNLTYSANTQAQNPVLQASPWFDDGKDLMFQNMIKVKDVVFMTGLAHSHRVDGGVVYANGDKANPDYGVYPTREIQSLCSIGDWAIMTNKQASTAYNTQNGSFNQVHNFNARGFRTENMISYSNMLIAIGTTEDGQEMTQRVRWSDLAYGNALPTDWDAANISSHAGFNDILDARGKLMHGVPFGSTLFLYTTEEVYEVRYVGAPDIFSFNKLPVRLNVLNRHCIAPLPTGHAVVTKDDIVIHNGVESKSIIRGKIKRRLMQEVKKGSATSVKLVANYATNELWVAYSNEPNEKPYPIYNAVAVYNWENETWTFRQIPPATYIGFIALPFEKQKVINDAPNTSTMINNNNQFIDGPGVDFKNSSMVISTVDKRMFILDEGDTTLQVQSSPAFVEKINMDFDELGWPHDQMKMVTSIHPQIQGTGKIYIKVGVQDNPYDPVIWQTPQIFDMKKDNKADFRITGRYISVRFESADDTLWKIYGYTIELKARGKIK